MSVFLGLGCFAHNNFFLLPSICMKIFCCHFLNSWVIIQCINIHFLYSHFWLRDIYVVSSFKLLWIKSIWKELSKCPNGRTEHSLGLFSKVVSLDFERDWFPLFWRNALFIFIVAIQVCTETSSGGVVLLFQVLISMSGHLSYHSYPLWWV